MGTIITVVLAVALAVASGVAMRWSHARNVVLRRKLISSENRRREIAGFLSRFASGISGEEGIDGAMQAAARYVCEQTDAESAAIYEIAGDELICAAVCGAYPLVSSGDVLLVSRPRQLLDVLRREHIALGDGLLGKIAAGAPAELIPDGSADPRLAVYPAAGACGSVMASPLMRDGVVTGVVSVINNRLHPNRPFSPSQFERLRQLMPQVLMVQNLARVYSEINRRNRLDQELEFARHLQQSLLPGSFPQWGPFSIAARTRSAKEVNGDFYDYIHINDHLMLALVGDSCGKGIPACMLAAMTRSFARSLADNFTTLTAFLRDLNAKLQRDTDADRFITLGCCLLNRRDSLLEFGRAGHTDLVECVHHHLRLLSPTGTGLGILPDDLASFETICIAMEPETTVMMFSDGLTEALGNDGEFGVKRLSGAFLNACESYLPLNEVIDRVMNEVAAYESSQNDDQTVLLIRQTGDAAEGVNVGG